MDQWNSVLDEAVDEQRDRFILASELRTSWLQQTLDLKPEQTRHLTVAGKGAATQCVAKWKEQTRRSLDRWKDRAAQQFAGRNVRYGLSLPRTEQLDQNNLWQHTVQKFDTAGVQQERSRFQRDAVARYLTAMLDKELWLTADQREPLEALVRESLPESFRPRQTYLKEVELLVIPLFGIADDDVSQVLTKSQQAAWQEIRNQFQVNGRTVLMDTQNGNQFHFALPP
ncbi:MAG: hypothetical protein R3C19_09340 [Planctomycetaceae bacterium]